MPMLDPINAVANPQNLAAILKLPGYHPLKAAYYAAYVMQAIKRNIGDYLEFLNNQELLGANAIHHAGGGVIGHVASEEMEEELAQIEGQARAQLENLEQENPFKILYEQLKGLQVQIQALQGQYQREWVKMTYDFAVQDHAEIHSWLQNGDHNLSPEIAQKWMENKDKIEKLLSLETSGTEVKPTSEPGGQEKSQETHDAFFSGLRGLVSVADLHADYVEQKMQMLTVALVEVGLGIEHVGEVGRLVMNRLKPAWETQAQRLHDLGNQFIEKMNPLVQEVNRIEGQMVQLAQKFGINVPASITPLNETATQQAFGFDPRNNMRPQPVPPLHPRVEALMTGMQNFLQRSLQGPNHRINESHVWATRLNTLMGLNPQVIPTDMTAMNRILFQSRAGGTPSIDDMKAIFVNVTQQLGLDPHKQISHVDGIIRKNLSGFQDVYHRATQGANLTPMDLGQANKRAHSHSPTLKPVPPGAQH